MTSLNAQRWVAPRFRHYRSKKDVIVPDHDHLLEQISERLRTSSHSTALAAVSDAVRLVLLHYIQAGWAAAGTRSPARCPSSGIARS